MPLLKKWPLWLDVALPPGDGEGVRQGAAYTNTANHPGTLEPQDAQELLGAGELASRFQISKCSWNMLPCDMDQEGVWI